MTRRDAIARALAVYDDGSFLALLDRRVARRSSSQEAGRVADLAAYLTEEMIPALAPLGFASTLLDNPRDGFGPFLVAERHEGAGLPTVLVYGHGDTVLGQEGQWHHGLDPCASRSRAIAGTDAAPPTTRASTRSTSWRSSRCSPPAAAGSASTPRS